VYFSNKLQNYLPKSGGTITGDLVLSGNPTNDFDLATYGYLKNKIASITGGGTVTDGIKTGTIVEVPYNYTYNNSAYLLCNGTAVPTSTYSDLYKVIGDTFTPLSPIKESAGVPWQSQCGFNSSTQNDITGWTSANNLASSVAESVTLVTKNYIYLLGGDNSNGSSNAIQRASFDANGDLSSTWSNVGTIPISAASAGYVATKDRIYLIGGWDGSNSLSTVYSAPINADGTLGDFRTETPLPVGRYSASCFVIKNKLYVVGGKINTTTATTTIYQATINSDGTLSSWITLPDFPINTVYAKALLIKDRIYILEIPSGAPSNNYYTTYDSSGNIGTWNYISNSTNKYGSAIVCTDNYVFSISGYDMVNGQWTTNSYRAPILADGSIGTWVQISNATAAILHSRAIITGNKIYLISGYDSSGNILNTVYSATFTSGITDYTPYYTDQPSASTTPSSPIKESAGIPWQSQCGFNPSTQSNITEWTSEASLVYPTNSAASLITKNYIYVLGGFNSGGELNTIQRASFDNDGNLTTTWSNVGTLPVAMYGMGYVATKDRFYLIGGNNNSGYLATIYSAPIKTDGSLGDFRSETSLPDGRYYAACFAIKNELYVVGGLNSNYLNTVYKTTINNDGTLSSWTTLPNFPISFSSGIALLIKDKIYIFGAYDGVNNVSEIYYATYDSNGNIGSWTNVANMPNNVHFSTIVCTDNYVFSIGGRINGGYTNAAYRAPISSDGSIGTWTQISDGPVTAICAQSAIAGNKIYYIGGVSEHYNSDTGIHDYQYLDTVYSAAFDSGITDYTPYYTDQPSTSSTSSTFCLPDLTSRSNTSPRMKYIIKT
jgi:N-acetylneuraminic acid mutarotase